MRGSVELRCAQAATPGVSLAFLASWEAELVFSEGVTEQAPLDTTGSFSGLLFCKPAVAWWPMALSRSLP